MGMTWVTSRSATGIWSGSLPEKTGRFSLAARARGTIRTFRPVWMAA